MLALVLGFSACLTILDYKYEKRSGNSNNLDAAW